MAISTERHCDEAHKYRSVRNTPLLCRSLLSVLPFIVGAVLLATPTSGYPTGAPMSACMNMTPNHGVNASSAAIPYTISLGNTTMYEAGDMIKVTVMGGKFKGILMKMREMGTDNEYGTWVTVPADFKTIMCTSSAATVTHKDRNEKEDVEFIWKAPAGAGVNVEVVATIVKEKTMWWKDITSISLASVTKSSSCAIRNPFYMVLMATLALFVTRRLV